jgi:hypothetical protein
MKDARKGSLCWRNMSYVYTMLGGKLHEMGTSGKMTIRRLKKKTVRMSTRWN